MVATTMSSLFVAFFTLLVSTFRTRAGLQAEILALRHQLAVFQKNAPRRLRLDRCDRLLWVVLYRFWSGWRRCLQMVKPDTVLRWHRRAFAWHWTRKSRRLPGLWLPWPPHCMSRPHKSLRAGAAPMRTLREVSGILSRR